jgi:CBS domain-containing protein
MSDAPAAGALLVRDVMQTDLPVVPSDASASEVAARMVARDWRHVLVSDADGALLGLVDRLRLMRHLSRLEGEDGGEPIVLFLLRDPVVTAPTAPLADAVRRMARHRIGSLPVVDGGRVVGLLSERLLLPFAERLLDPDQSAPALTADLPGAPPLVG